jgi:hypothetical protein
VLPQIAKNWTMSNEPLAPFFYFGPPQIDTEQVYYSAATTMRLVLTYPLALVFGRYWAQHGTLSILFPAFLPFGFLRFAQGPRCRLLLFTLAALFGLLVWIALRPSTFAPRYILCVLLVPFLFAADGVARASMSASWPLRMLIVLTLAFVLGESARAVRVQVSTAWRYAASADTEAYEQDDVFNMARLLNASAAPGTRIALMGFYRFPLRADLLECGFSQAQLLRFRSLGREMAVDVFLDGADYLVFDLMTHKGALPADFSGLPSWLLIDQIYKGPRIWIYRLTGGPGSPARKAKCMRDGQAWIVRSVAAAAEGQMP